MTYGLFREIRRSARENNVRTMDPDGSVKTVPVGHNPSPAMARAVARITEAAKRAAVIAIKDRARAYAQQPRHLDAIIEGLSSFSPKPMVQILSIIRRNSYTFGPQKYRHVGFGGEVPAINLRGAMLYARYSRAIANRRQP